MESRRTAADVFLVLLTAMTCFAQASTSHPPGEPTPRTRVLLLGTGTPVPDPDRSGPATAVVVDDTAILLTLDRALSDALSPLL